MEDLLTKLAYNASSSRPRSGDIGLLGRRAAKAFIEKDADSLSDAVADIAKEEGLSRAQVQHLATAANQATWREGFHNTGDGEFNFAPADASAILDTFKADTEGVREPSLDYYSDPVGERSVDEFDQMLETFKVENPAPEYEKLEPNEDVLPVQEKVASATDFVRSRVNELEAAVRDEGEELYRMLKVAHLEGAGVLQLCKVAQHACMDQQFAADLMQTVADRLEREGHPLDKRAELTKLAQALIPDTEHPAYKKLVDFEKLARAYAFRSDQYEEYRAGTARMTEILAERLRAR